MQAKVLILLLALGIFSLGQIVSAGAEEPEKVLVFAAASMSNALNEVMDLFQSKGLGKVTASYGSSSTLAKQIENGAPAKVFISANVEWMDYLDKKKLIDPATRINLVGNSLVLIAPTTSSLTTAEIKPSFPLAEMLGENLLAMGDPDHVPAGTYGKAALEKLGVWSRVEKKVARAKDVRAALTLVERGECPLGIVYSTDAKITTKVKVVAVFPAETHPAIEYPMALLTGPASKPTTAFYGFMKSAEAKAIFEKHGFRTF